MNVALTRLQKGNLMDKPPTEKQCSDCGVVKPLRDFKKSHGYRDGRLKRCRPCEKKRIDSLKGHANDTELFQHDKYYSF